MDLQWIDDLIAIDEAGSLSRAAEHRNITQPAFSRRVRALEEWLGAPALDRSHRPARLTPAIKSQIGEFRRIASGVRRMREEVNFQAGRHSRVVVVAQHSLSISLLPTVAAALSRLHPDVSLRVRSANRSDSLALMLTGQASIFFYHDADSHPLAIGDDAMEKHTLGHDTFVPVGNAAILQELTMDGWGSRPLPVIGYPIEVFFGQLFHEAVRPAMAQGTVVNLKIESALVPSVLAMAIAGLGAAWVPRQAAIKALSDRALFDLSDWLPSVDLRIIAARVPSSMSTTQVVWESFPAIRSTLEAAAAIAA